MLSNPTGLQLISRHRNGTLPSFDNSKPWFLLVEKRDIEGFLSWPGCVAELYVNERRCMIRQFTHGDPYTLFPAFVNQNL